MIDTIKFNFFSPKFYKISDLNAQNGQCSNTNHLYRTQTHESNDWHYHIHGVLCVTRHYARNRILKCISHDDPAIITTKTNSILSVAAFWQSMFKHTSEVLLFSVCALSTRRQHCRCLFYTKQYNHSWHCSRSEYIMCALSINKLWVYGWLMQVQE